MPASKLQNLNVWSRFIYKLSRINIKYKPINC